MKRMLIVVAIFGCEAGLQIRPPIPVANVTVAVPVGGPPPGGETTVATPPEGGGAQQAVAGAPSCTGDSQCMTEQDILVCVHSKWDCRVTHTISQPTEQTRMVGQFLQVYDGQQVSTDHWYVTRPLGQGEELRLGQPVIFQEDHVDHLNTKVWMGAPTHDAAIKVRWHFGAVTDLSDLPKGIVHVEENSVHVSNVRVILNGGTQTPPK
jgi:hypothetical protein